MVRGGGGRRKKMNSRTQVSRRGRGLKSLVEEEEERQSQSPVCRKDRRRNREEREDVEKEGEQKLEEEGKMEREELKRSLSRRGRTRSEIDFSYDLVFLSSSFFDSLCSAISSPSCCFVVFILLLFLFFCIGWRFYFSSSFAILIVAR